MKIISRAVCQKLAAVFTTAAVVVVISCTPGGSNNAGNSNTGLTPPPTGSPSNTATPAPSPTPSSTPSCDNGEVNRALKARFDADNGFNPIRRTVTFFARDCNVYLVGYTKNLGLFKAMLNMPRNLPPGPSFLRSDSINFDNLYIQKSEYPWGEPSGGACPAGYKACNDICIPETDTCYTEIQ
jgi:hypothetical protein